MPLEPTQKPPVPTVRQRKIKIGFRPVNDVMLYAEMSDAVDILGDKALKIAVYDVRYMHTVMLLISENTVAPGAFAEALNTVKLPDSRDRQRPAMLPGPAKELAVQWSSHADNLLHGLSTEQMASLCGLTRYDKRLDWYCRTITRAVRRALKVEIGWYRGRFRVLTTAQVKIKETRLARNNLQGGARRSDARLGIQTGGGMKATSTLYVQAALFEDVELHV